METHHHPHTDLLDLGWERMGEIVRDLTERIRRDFAPDVVVGIAKGGVIPGVIISSALSLDFFPIRLSTRKDEQVVRNVPELLVHPTSHLSGRKVLLVDDICITGRTLKLAVEAVQEAGALDVRTATLAAHGASAKPGWCGILTDALILMPWDRDVLTEGRWTLNPEYERQCPRGEAPGPVTGPEDSGPPCG